MRCVSGEKIFTLVVTDNFERFVFSNTSCLGQVEARAVFSGLW